MAGTSKKAVFAILITLALVACGAPPPPPPPPAQSSPQWADALESPDIYAVIRVQKLKRDAVYGQFWQTLMRVAEARGFTRGASMVEALSGSDEVVIGIARGNDALLALRGVPASLDPATINDGAGHPLFHLVNERTKVPEYELSDRRSADASAGAVFVLPDRTWVGTLGDARGRARQVFASPIQRSAPKVDADALLAVRLSGKLTRMFERHPLYGPLTKKLSTTTFALKPGKQGLVIGFEYADADATAWGEMQAKRLVADLVAKDEKRFGWLKEAKVAYEENTVFVRVALPPRLLEELPNASGSDFGF